MNEKNAKLQQWANEYIFLWGLQLNIFFNLFPVQVIVSTSICPTFANLTPTLVPPCRVLETWLIDFKSKFNTQMNFTKSRSENQSHFMLELRFVRFGLEMYRWVKFNVPLSRLRPATEVSSHLVCCLFWNSIFRYFNRCSRVFRSPRDFSWDDKEVNWCMWRHSM